MKIIFYIDNLSAGGKERRFVELLKGLQSNTSIEFEIVVMGENIHYKEIFEINKKIHYLIRSTKKDLSIFRKFYKICKAYKPDIVHCWDSMTAVYSIPACKLLKIKLINGMVIDTPVKQNILNKNWLRAKIAFPFSDRIIGNSHAGLVGYGAPANKSCCVYNGMDLGRFKNLKDSNIVRNEIFGDNNNNIFVIGMVAAFEPRKDYKTLISGALSLLGSNDSVRFILVGDGSDFMDLKNSIPPGYQNKIIFLGKRNDVEAIVGSFDVGILLTNSKVHGEGISNSLIEYMASGKPVIATRGGGTNEVVINNQNGYLINPNDSNQLVKSILKLLSNKELRTQFGTSGFNMVQKTFDLKIMTRNYISVYQKLIQENKN